MTTDHLEARVTGLESKIDDIHSAVVGTTQIAGMGERLRTLESAYKVITGIAYAAATSVVAGLAVMFGGHK